MNFTQLLGSWSQSGSVVTINATTAPSLAAFLGQYYTNQGTQIVISGATVTPNAQTVQITGTGTADFLNVATNPVTATLSLDTSGNLVIGLAYTMLSPSGPTGWTFATTFPNLPPGQSAGALVSLPGDVQLPTDVTPQPPLLSTLPLVTANLLIASEAYTDPTYGAVPAGISFSGTVQPSGLLGALGSALPTTPVPLTGTIVIPQNPASIAVPIVPTTTNIGATPAFPWDVTPPLPGINLSAPLGQALSVGSASITNTSFLVYSPTSSNWPSDPLLQSAAAVTGTLTSQSAGISATAFITVDPLRTGTAAFVDVRIQGMTIANLANLSDLTGSSNLVGALPSSLTSTVQALSSFGLTSLWFSILAGSPGLTLESVGVTVGAPGAGWSVWGNGQIQVSNLSLAFTVLSPMASPSITIDVQGTATIAGTAVNIDAGISSGNPFLSAQLQSGVTLPSFGTLLQQYLPGLTGVAAPSGLTLNTLSASIDSNGLQLGGSMAQQTPWQLSLGPAGLQISNVTFDLVAPASGSAMGAFGGTIGFGNGVSLTMSQSVPGPTILQATCPSVNFSHVLSTLTNAALSLPSGFDLVLNNPSILIDLSKTSPSFKLATQLPGVGTIVFEVLSVNGTWGCVAGISLNGQISSVSSSLQVLQKLEGVLGLSGLTLVVASVTPQGFSLPGLSAFNNPALGSGSIALPASGLVAGLNASGTLTLGKSSGLSVVQKLLGLSASTTLTATVQIPSNPDKTSVSVGIQGTFLNGKANLSGTVLATIVNHSPSLAITGKLTMPIQKQSCEFDVSMQITLSPPSAFLSGTMAASVNFAGITLSNVALQIGVDGDGGPSVGVAATVSVPTGNFNAAVAVFLDSGDPAKSMLAGSVSDLSLADVANALANMAGFTVPSSIAGALAQVSVSGTHKFLLPLSAAGDLNGNNAANVSADFAQAGITIPADPKQLLIVQASQGQWYVADLSTMNHYTLVRGPDHVKGSLNAQLYFAPLDTQIGTLPTYKQGFRLSGTLSFFGFSLTAAISVATSQGISVTASMTPLTFLNASFFSLTGAGGTGGPLFSMSTYTDTSQTDASLQPPHLLVSGQLSLLGSKESVYISVGTGGLSFNVSLQAPGNVVTASVAGTIGDSGTMSASGSITVGLSGFSLNLGALGTVSLSGVSLGGTVSLGYAKHTATLSLSGSATINGQGFSTGTLTLKAGTDTLTGLPQTVANALTALVNNYFLGNVNQWINWAKQGVMQGIADVAHIGQVLNNTFKMADADAANALKAAGYVASDITNVLSSVWNDSGNAAASILQGLGYDTNTINAALKSVYGATHVDWGHTDAVTFPHVDSHTDTRPHDDTSWLGVHTDYLLVHDDTIHDDTPAVHSDWGTHIDA